MKEEQITLEQQTRERLNSSCVALGKAILSSEPYQRFVNARDNFRVSDDAKQASLEYNTVLRDYQMKANYGTLTTEDEKILEEAKSRAMSNAILKEFFESQQDLISYYQEVNLYISEKLKFNFASLAKPASSCCG